LDHKNYKVVVVDNASPNGSLEKIISWAEGRVSAEIDNNELASLSCPASPKPREYKLFNAEGSSIYPVKELGESEGSLVFIQSNENKGFSAGNNIGIKYALDNGDADYIWLLNNDTVVDHQSILFFLERMSFYKKNEIKAGIVGAKLLYYHDPQVIQAAGGIFNKVLATTKHVGMGERDRGQFDCEIGMDYPVGASLFVSVQFIRDVGLMCEDYFLYFEELDWVLRGCRKGWVVGYSWDSKIFHKEGGSIGSNSRAKKKSRLSDYYGVRSRIIFTRKFYPKYLFLVRAGLLITAAKRIIRGQFGRAGMVVRILFSE